MRWAACALILVSLAGCMSSPAPAAPKPQLTSFHAVLGAGGAPLDVTFVAGAVLDERGELASAYVLTIRDDYVLFEPSLKVLALDGNLHVRREAAACPIVLKPGECEATVAWKDEFPPLGILWPLIADLPYPKSIVQGHLVIDGPDGRYTYGDNQLVALSGPLPGRERSQPLFGNGTVQPGWPLDTIPPWPAVQPSALKGWQNPLFPGADENLLGLDFAPLDAWSYLSTVNPVVAATMARGGCVVQTTVERLPGSEPVRALAKVEFIVGDELGNIQGFTVRRQTALQTNTFAFDAPMTLGTWPGPSCTQRQASPWPAASALGFLQATRSLGMHEHAAFVAVDMPYGPSGHDAYRLSNLDGSRVEVWGDAATGLLVRANMPDLRPEQIP